MSPEHNNNVFVVSGGELASYKINRSNNSGSTVRPVIELKKSADIIKVG